MDDLISRQAAIDSIRRIKANYCETADDQILLIDKAMAMTGLMMLPSAQQWIPVSEKLPDRVGFYWTTAVGGSGTRTMTSRFFDGTKWERKRRDYTKVIAWMPLPEAYKEGE